MAHPRRRIFSTTVLAAGFFMAGCATVDGPGVATPPVPEMRVDERGLVGGTGFASIDLVVACNRICQGFGTVGEIVMARGPVAIAVDPVANDSRFDLNRAAFDRAILAQLASRAPKNWRFREGGDEVGSGRVDFYLSGRLQRLTPLQAGGPEVLLYSAQLVDASNSELLWEGATEVKYTLAMPSTGT